MGIVPSIPIDCFVFSGVDVVSLLQLMHMPNGLVEKVASTPPSAGAFVVAFILYKVSIRLL